MKKLALLLFLFSLTNLYSQTIIPVEWVNSAITVETEEDKLALVEQFEQIIGYDNFPNTKQASNKPYINLLTANIDNDPQAEQLMYIGYGVYPYLFTVLKKNLDGWVVMHQQQVTLFDEEPELMLLLGEDSRKTICIKNTDVRSTNVKSDFNYYFKMINGKFTEVLKIPVVAYISGWNHFINQDVDVVINYNGDDIIAEIDYDFFTVAEINYEDGTSEEQTFFLLDGKESVKYQWNEENKKYDLVTDPGNKLNEDKIKVFGNFNDHYAVANAYREDLQNLQKYGSEEQKVLIKYFFDNLDKIVKQYSGKPFNTSN